MTNAEFNESFNKRIRAFVVRVFKFLDTLPRTSSTNVVSYQLGKSSSSVGANFRAFCRGRSKNEKYSKICIVVEEADETEYWLLFIRDINWGNQLELNYLIQESLEILKIVSSIKNKMSE